MKREFCSTLAATGALVAFMLTPAVHAQQAQAELRIGESLEGLDVFAQPKAPPFPLSAVTEPPLDREMGHFVYADADGRVRTFVITRGGNQRNAGDAFVRWEKRFRKQAVTDTARFTVNKSWLAVQTGAAPQQLQVMSASLFMKVSLIDESQELKLVRNQTPSGQFVTWVKPPPLQPQFQHMATVGTSGSTPASPVLWREKTLLFGDTFYEYWPKVGVIEPEEWRQVETTLVQRAGSIYYETAPYHGEIDLSGVPIGAAYRVIYEMRVNAQDDGHESVALAQLGDPLDVDSGFSIETDSTPLDDEDEAALQLCDAQPDFARFAPNDDVSAITDRYTGLIWQRCPVGYTLNLSGTPDDLSDDRCASSSDPRSTWRAALQSSVANASNGADVWRLPNVKELQSIVESSCTLPAIDTAIFPPTQHTQFWSGTPTPADGGSAETVDFAFGESRSLAQTAIAAARLVRDDPAGLQERRTSVTVQRPAPVLEGDDGTRTVSFQILLDGPDAQDVSIAYRTLDATATAGEDYTATSGTLLIPAGITTAQVQVEVLGDNAGEGDESFILSLDSVSANAYGRIDRAAGSILDDEPVVTALEVDGLEPQTGTGSIDFQVRLDRPAAADVTVSYELVSGSATGGDDYLVPQNGELVIPAGETIGGVNTALLRDPLVEGDEYFTFRVTDVSANARISATQGEARAWIMDADDAPWLGLLNDTGMDLCADADQGSLTCPQPGFPGQDAEQGHDFTANDYTDGAAGFVFTKLDAAGAPLANQSVQYNATPWSCVRDERTQLTWEVKTDDGGLRDKDWTYTWLNSTGINDGGSAGTANGGVCVDTANCDSEKFVAAVNAAGLCGFNDWRLPTRDELLSIVMQNPLFSHAPYDEAWFPNTLALGGDYLTANPRARWTGNAPDTGSVWTVYWNRGNGQPRDRPKSLPNPLRLVRGAP
jgi:uncharacterized protein DUF1566/Calx-beta domain-containing protein